MTEQPRAKTEDECRDEFLNYLGTLVRYVANEKRTPGVLDKLNLLVFGILNVFDGTAGGCLTLDLVTGAHPDDEEYRRKQGDNWTPIGLNIADGTLHEQWHKYEAKR